MAWRQRKELPSIQYDHQSTASLRIVASGTIFTTHTLNVRSFPSEGSTARAQSVSRRRGGAAANSLAVISQFSGTKTWLVAPIGGGTDGAGLVRELEEAGVSTKFCVRREGEGIPTAFIIKSNPGDTRNTALLYNPIPDVSHEEFIRLLSPLLCPPTYLSSNLSPTQSVVFRPLANPPFDWMHFEGRTVQTTLNNLSGLDGLAREREWRDKMVFSVLLNKPGRQGQEALIPHADVIFFSKAYALSQSFTSPRPFLLSLFASAPPHALLITTWGNEGSALLSVPTREYFQASSFVPEPDDKDNETVESVRSSTAFGTYSSEDGGWDRDDEGWGSYSNGHDMEDDEGTEDTTDDDVVDEEGAEDAFVAGMIYALSRRVLPGPPYTPPNTTHASRDPSRGLDGEKGRWRLEECLRFATELSGRKMRRKGFNGLARAMEEVGWFDS